MPTEPEFLTKQDSDYYPEQNQIHISPWSIVSAFAKLNTILRTIWHEIA